MTKESIHRPDVLEGAPLHYAPQNELGVVYLFSFFIKKLRLRVDQIRPQFPDCIAYQKVGGKEKRVRIEFGSNQRTLFLTLKALVIRKRAATG